MWTINPIFVVIEVGRIAIAGLLRTSREAIGPVVSVGNVNQIEVKGKNRHDPSVNASLGHDIGVREHAFDIGRVDLDDEVADTDEVQTKFSEGAMKAIEFELGLREARFSRFESDRPEAGVVTDARIFGVALTEEVANCEIRRVDC